MALNSGRLIFGDRNCSVIVNACVEAINSICCFRYGSASVADENRAKETAKISKKKRRNPILLQFYLEITRKVMKITRFGLGACLHIAL